MVRFDAGYRGARFYKCDLQMQTPADAPRWSGPETLEDPQATANAFIRRCHELGLEVIGITDHNFASKDFIPHLRNAIGRLERETGDHITLLPGFEIEANVGRGCHVLALFPEDYDLGAIDHVVTECGIPPPRFVGGTPTSSRLTLQEIIRVVQVRSDHGLRGLVVCPHSQAEAGIFDTERIADWLQQAEFVNPDLLCIEVPKPPSEMSPNWQKLLAAGEDCEPAWRRRRPIACIRSSDAKALLPDDGAANFIGFRHTWIKMSQPGIEGLRQAFLDPDSRIRLTDENPDASYQYPVIQSLRITNAPYLADQSISFSPNLTAIIGGGGTGKSTVVEYMRATLGQVANIQGEARANFEKLKRTLLQTTVVELTVDRDGQSWVLRSAEGSDPVVISGEQVPNISKFLPARFFSQREIYAIAESRDARARLLDNLIRDDLDELGRLAADQRSRIERYDVEIQREPELTTRLADLETERLDLDTKLKRVEEGQASIAAWRRLRPEKAFLESVIEDLSTRVQDLRALASQYRGIGPTPAESMLAGANGDVIRAVAQSAADIAGTAADRLDELASQFQEDADRLVNREDITVWRNSLAVVEGAHGVQLNSLRAGGVDPDQVKGYEDALAVRVSQIAEIRSRVAHIAELREERGTGLEDLTAIWVRESELRETKATEINAVMPRQPGSDHGFVEVVVDRMGDGDAFDREMSAHRRDGRRFSDEDWSSLITAVIGSTGAGESPAQTWIMWMDQLAAGDRPLGYPWEAEDRRSSVLVEWFNDEARSAVEMLRVPDRVAVRLYRRDGSLAGELESGLSVGQKCTAILAMLLAQDDVPAVIDQPEDELDNEFTFRDLVPMLRRIKEQRQLIIVTHDPNIPVNADAELVYALESRAGKGQVRDSGVDGPAVGAIDRSSVRDAVEEIMEGSEEAFRRRYEKYGF